MLFFVFSNIILAATNATKNTKFVISNLEDARVVFSSENQLSLMPVKIVKMVFNLRTNNDSRLILDLNKKEIIISKLQPNSVLEYYDERGIQVSNEKMSDIETLKMNFPSIHASFEISSEGVTWYTNTYEYNPSRENNKPEKEGIENKKIFFYNTPTEKTLIYRENGKYVLIPDNNGGLQFFLEINEVAPGMVHRSRKNKEKTIFTTTNPLTITVGFGLLGNTD